MQASSLPQDPQKVPIHVTGEGDVQWNVAKHLMRKEAERLRAEADAIMAVAAETSSLHSLPSGQASLVASMLESAGLEGFEHESFGSPGYVQPPLPPLPPCEWLASGNVPISSLGVVPESVTSTEASCMNGTLSAHLMEMSSEDPACVFVARQLHKLGFQSREKLRQHYSQYGKVLRVLVADKRVKAFPGTSGQRKTRPGGLGLVVMKTAASTQKILEMGSEQIVYGHKVIVQPYEGPKTNTMMFDDAFTPVASGGFDSRQSSDESYEVSMRGGYSISMG